MEAAQDREEEVCGMVEVLHVLFDDRPSLWGAVPQIVHNAGFTGAAWCGEQDVLALERFPEILKECIPVAKIGWVDRGSGVKVWSRFHG